MFWLSSLYMFIFLQKTIIKLRWRSFQNLVDVTQNSLYALFLTGPKQQEQQRSIYRRSCQYQIKHIRKEKYISFFFIRVALYSGGQND